MSKPIGQKLSLDQEKLREVMRYWGTGVAVASSVFGGVHHGMTVNSFTSISLDPGLVLIALEKSTRTHELILKSKVFGVTILTEDQEILSDRFAGRETEDLDRFEGIETFTLHSDCLLIKEALAYFDCKVSAVHLAGSHTLFLGEVAAAAAAENADDLSPLMYYNRGYRNLTA